MKHKLHSWLDAFRWRKLLLIWAVFLAMAAILFAERSGIRYASTQFKIDYLPVAEVKPASIAMFGQPVTCLLLYDSGQEGTDRVKEQFDQILLDMKVGTQAVDVHTNKNYNAAHKVWVKGMMDMKLANGQPIYPDANSTLRLTYGQVLPYAPADGVKYDYYTTLKGAMEKEDPDNWEFVVPAKLKQLYQAKDFGRYAMPNGEMPICFIVNTDNTGGNSGSPVFNAKGELIGTGFDRNYEGLTGDIAFRPSSQRAACVDIRYTLFIIDKYAGASHLIEEMTIK